MQRYRTIWLVLAIIMALAPAHTPSAAAAAAPADLAYRWAPIHHQDTDASDFDADYLSAINFDGDWNPLNNWENQRNTSLLRAYVYYSITETRTHWFIGYAFYHPRDWSDILGGTDAEHENDLEGILLTVRKDGSPYGALEAMVTVFHNDFYSYKPANSRFGAGQEDIDGKVRMDSYGGVARPTTFQQAKGHGIQAWDGSDFPGHDGIVYYPSRSSAEVPDGGNDRFVQYTLIDIFAPGEIWDRRFESQLFAEWGVFRGDEGHDNAAQAPWRWDDHNDGAALTGGELATDPARLIDSYFDNVAPFSRLYTNNRYAPNPSMQPDLFALRDSAPDTSQLTLFQLRAADGLQTLVQTAPTALFNTGPSQSAAFAMADYNRDGLLDLYAMLRTGTGSGSTEVHILDGASGYQRFLLHAATPLPLSGDDGSWAFAVGYYDSDDYADLYAIKKQGVSSTEVHILNGRDSYGSFLLQTGTALHRTGSDASWVFAVGDLNLDGVDDVYAIHKSALVGQRVQVHVLSGAASFQQFMLQVEVPLDATPNDGAWMFTLADYNQDGALDLYAIDKTAPASTVHVFDGRTNLQTTLGVFVTPLGSTGSDWSWEWQA